MTCLYACRCSQLNYPSVQTIQTLLLLLPPLLMLMSPLPLLPWEWTSGEI